MCADHHGSRAQVGVIQDFDAVFAKNVANMGKSYKLESNVRNHAALIRWLVTSVCRVEPAWMKKLTLTPSCSSPRNPA